MDDYGVDWGSCSSDQDFEIYDGYYDDDHEGDSIGSLELEEEDDDDESHEKDQEDDGDSYEKEDDGDSYEKEDVGYSYEEEDVGYSYYAEDAGYCYEEEDVGYSYYEGDAGYSYYAGDAGYSYYAGDVGYSYEEEDVGYSYYEGDVGYSYEEEDDESSIGSEALSSSSDEVVEKREKWIEHYSSLQKILLVGEGNYSFSLSLAKAFRSARNIIATSLDSLGDLEKKFSDAVGNVRQLEEMGGLVLSGLDATQMRDHHFLTTQKFDCIVYNFPHVGFQYPERNACQIMMNIELVKGFLRNAKALLKKVTGEIHVTHKNGDPYDKWDLVKNAQKIGLVLHETVPFSRHKYPGYVNKRAHGRFSDDTFALGRCTTYKFRLPKTYSYFDSDYCTTESYVVR